MVGPQLKGLQSCLLMAEFSTCDGFPFLFTHSWVTVQLRRWAARTHGHGCFLELRASRGKAVIDLQDDTNFLWPVEWDRLVLERKPIQNEFKIDVGGPSVPRYFGKQKRRQRMCVLEEISVLAISN